MGYILKMLNVIKEADCPADRDRLIAKGYTLVDCDSCGSPDDDSIKENDLSKHSLPELKAMAKDAGIKGYSGMEAAALIAALTEKSGERAGGDGGDSGVNGGEGNGDK